MKMGVQLGRRCRRLKQEASEKRRLLDFLISNCSWKDGQLTARFRQPFDFLADTAMEVANASAAGRSESAKNEIWLAIRDTYRTLCLAPEPDFQRLLEGVQHLTVAA